MGTLGIRKFQNNSPMRFYPNFAFVNYARRSVSALLMATCMLLTGRPDAVSYTHLVLIPAPPVRTRRVSGPDLALQPE